MVTRQADGRTSGKNWNRNTTSSQFSRDGGIQFSMRAMGTVNGRGRGFSMISRNNPSLEERLCVVCTMLMSICIYQRPSK